MVISDHLTVLHAASTRNASTESPQSLSFPAACAIVLRVARRIRCPPSFAAEHTKDLLEILNLVLIFAGDVNRVTRIPRVTRDRTRESRAAEIQGYRQGI